MRKWLGIKDAPAPKVQEEKAGMNIRNLLTPHPADVRLAKPLTIPEPPPGVIPDKMAMDAATADPASFAWAGESALQEGLTFLGYPYLAELTQRPEYRRPAEIIAKEMTRKWLKIQCSGEEDKTDKIKAIEDEFKRLGVQSCFRKAAEQECFFGRGQIYIDTGATDNPEELKTPLSESIAKIGRGSLKAIRIVEPMWTYPNLYNSNDPLKPDFYKPSSWFIMGKLVHTSRMMMFISREVPDLIKPVYAFGGLSLTQILKPYVDNW